MTTAQKVADMPFTRLLLLAFLLLSPTTQVAGAAPPDAAEPADCAEPLPLVLNVALPLEPGSDLADRRDRLQAALTPLYHDVGRCPSTRPLQVHVAVGTDYQVLDWIGTGAVDAAVVSDLSVHLLRRDGVELLELVPPPAARDALTPAWSPRLRSFELTGGERRERPDAAADLAAFRDMLWKGLATPEIAALTRPQILARPELCEGRAREERPPYRIVFPSHLAVPGYLAPVAETGTWLEDRLAQRPPRGREALRECYWRAFFDHACFLFGDEDAATECAVPGGGAADRVIELRSDRRRRPPNGAGAAASPAAAAEIRDRLVIRGATAKTLFHRADLQPPAGLPDDEVIARLFGERTPGDGEADEAPEPFRSHLQPEPYFGVRTFAFTVEESLHLLRLHQSGSGRSSLALVLPGGGVKAAFQSQVIDALYDGRRLLNYRLADTAGPGQPLAVEYVVGTSGGALLGSFVARLGSHGPANLSRTLWSLPVAGRPGESQLLSSGDVFGWTDLPRYVSLVVILCVFGVVLAAVSLGRRSRFSPDRTGQGTTTLPSFRPRLIAVSWPALLAAPILVRLAGGDAAIEHVPEIEGLFFAILVAVAMFADQCLVLDPAHPGTVRARDRWLPPEGLMVAGAGLVLAPFLARPWLRDADGSTATFAAAYGVFAVAAAALLLATARRSPDGSRRWRDLASWLALFVIASLAAAWTLHALPPVVLAVLDSVPLLFLSLLATPLVVGLVRLGRRRPGRLGAAFGRLTERLDRLSGSRDRLRWIGARLTLPALFFALSFMLMDLCRPPAAMVAGPLRDLAGAASKLGSPLASLMVSVGLLLLVSGWLLRVWERAPHYRFDQTGLFVDAMVFVTVGLAFAVYLVLGIASSVFPDRLSMFELTPEFWLGLVAVTAVLAVALVAWGSRGHGRGGLSQRLHESLLYLCSRHPNAQLTSRRFVRVGVLAVIALGWWNFVVAPGLYGNRYAVDYLLKAEERFAAGNRNGSGGAVPALTARLLAPANALDKTDGTRYLLVVPDSEPCPKIRQPPGSGAIWYVFRAVSGEQEGHREPADEACTDDLDLGEQADLERLQDFIFASGSPFPIFPAHFVRPDEDGPREALVDGGYTNNTPVEAASLAGAAQVLIIQSSNPLARRPASETGVIGWLQGPLVRNVLRLPGFLFERSQQSDRRSRRDLFVVSLSPLWRADWPFLSDFRRRTVETMQETASRDIGRRIGIVESWGPPVFQLSAEVPAVAPAP